jgi:hypothetical protein
MNEPLPPIGSVSELTERMMRERRYGALAMVAVRKMGGDGDTLREAPAWLLFEASQTGEPAVLAVVNACRELV